MLLQRTRVRDHMTGPDETTGREPPGAGQCGQLATGQAADSDGGTRTYSRKRRSLFSDGPHSIHT